MSIVKRLHRAPSAAQLETCKTIDIKGHKSKVHSVTWDATGTMLASGSTDHSVRLWKFDGRDIYTVTQSFITSIELKGHTAPVNQLRWKMDPEDCHILASASTDKTVRVWDAKNSGACIQRISTPGENINLCWRPQHSEIAVGNKDDLVLFIDAKSGKIEKRKQFAYEVNEMVWNKGGQLFFISTGLGTISILNSDLEDIYSLSAHTANCYCIDFEASGRFFATGSADALVSLWDASEYICLRTFSKLDWPVRSLSFTFDGEWLASAAEDRFIDISSVSTGETIYRLACATPVNTVSWHPKVYLLAFAGDDNEGVIRIFGYPAATAT